MGRKGYERISQREYARRLGVSNTAISKAIEAGKINKGWDAKEKKILFEIANKEWGDTFIKQDAQHSAEVDSLTKHIQPYNNPDKPKPQSQRPPRDEAEDTISNAFGELEEYELAVSSKAPFAEALRIEKVAKARQAIVDLRKSTGELVSKADVYKNLFGFGQTIRTAVLAVPDRCIDEVITAPNRSEAYNIMTKYLHEALEKLSNTDQLNLKPEEN